MKPRPGIDPVSAIDAREQADEAHDKWKRMHNHYYVRIVSRKGEVVEEMGPMTKRDAQLTQRGASINLNHDEYSVAIVEAKDMNNLRRRDPALLTFPIKNDRERAQAEQLEKDLADASDHVPGWMYEASGLDAVVARIDEAIMAYDQETAD